MSTPQISKEAKKVLEALANDQPIKRKKPLIPRQIIEPLTPLPLIKPIEVLSPTIYKHDEILALLISKAEKLSSIQWAELVGSPKISASKYQIAIVDKVGQLAIENNFAICHNNQSVHLYNGAFWKKYDNDRFSKFLGEIAQKLGVDKWLTKSYLFREQLIKQFFASAYLPVPSIDKTKVLINLQGGTFVIKASQQIDAQQRGFKQSDFLTYQLPFSYSKEAQAPIFNAFLNRVLPEAEKQKLLAEYLGYLFIRHGSNILKEERILVLFGSGANGKSVIFEILRALLGTENMSNYSLESLTDTNGYYRAQIDTKILNYASEISEKMNNDRFKLMASGEPIEARHPSGRAMILDQYAKLMFNCNVLPRETEKTHGYFRRFLIIPFEVEIPEAEQNKRLHSEIIEAELPGVFNWILEGLTRLLENRGFTECESSNKALAKYRLETDNVRLFVDEENYRPQKVSEKGTPLGDLYSSYKSYCNEGGYKPLNKVNFSKRLTDLGYYLKRGTGGQREFNIIKTTIV